MTKPVLVDSARIGPGEDLDGFALQSQLRAEAAHGEGRFSKSLVPVKDPVSGETVLDKDEMFFLRATANLSTGGTAIDLTDVVHPDNREMAVRAVRAPRG